jgi:hypothetical protein
MRRGSVEPRAKAQRFRRLQCSPVTCRILLESQGKPPMEGPSPLRVTRYASGLLSFRGLVVGRRFIQTSTIRGR